MQGANEQSFTDLLVPLLQSGYRLAGAMLHDPLAAEDVVQEASLIAWRKLPGLVSSSLNCSSCPPFSLVKWTRVRARSPHQRLSPRRLDMLWEHPGSLYRDRHHRVLAISGEIVICGPDVATA